MSPWSALLLCLVAVFAAIAFGLVWQNRRRVRTVPEGSVAVVHRMDRFERLAGPGPYFLRPFEVEVIQVYVRQREATIAIPNIITGSGMPVVVNLSYAYRLDLNQMNPDERYYTEADRNKQQQTLIRDAISNLIQSLPSTAASNPPQAPSPSQRPDVAAIFSPFAGPNAARLRSELKGRLAAALAPHGIILTDSPVVITGLILPASLGDAYTASLGAQFDASTRAEIMQRVRAAVPDMSEAGLIQLLNIIQNPTADLHTIFANGMVTQDMLLNAGGPVIQQRVAPPQPPPAAAPSTPAPAPAPAPAATPGNTGSSIADAGTAGPDYPLVPADNALLKSTRPAPTAP